MSDAPGKFVGDLEQLANALAHMSSQKRLSKSCRTVCWEAANVVLASQERISALEAKVKRLDREEMGE